MGVDNFERLLQMVERLKRPSAEDNFIETEEIITEIQETKSPPDRFERLLKMAKRQRNPRFHAQQGLLGAQAQHTELRPTSASATPTDNFRRLLGMTARLKKKS